MSTKAIFGNSSTKFRVELQVCDNYYLWARRMNTVLISNQYWTIVSGLGMAPIGVPEERSLDFAHRSQNALSNTVLAVSNNCLSTTEDTDDLKALWDEVNRRYHAPSEATIDARIAAYHRVMMREGESITSYVDRVSGMEKRLIAVGQKWGEVQEIRALLLGLPDRSANIRDIIREFEKTRHEAVSMLTAKEAEEEESANRVQHESQTVSYFTDF